MRVDPSDFPAEVEELRERTVKALAREKGEIWAQKVIYMTGMRHILHQLPTEGLKEAGFRMLTVEVVRELERHFPDFDQSEFVEDCKRMEDIVLSAAHDLWDKAHAAAE